MAKNESTGPKNTAPTTPNSKRVTQLKELWLAIKNGIWDSDQWLFGLSTLGSFALLGLCYLSFFKPQYEVSYTIVMSYIGTLTLYAGNKELIGWVSSSESIKIRPGEFFVAMWVLTAYLMGIVETLSQKEYITPPAVLEITGLVGTIFIGRIISKEMRRSRAKKAEEKKNKKDGS